ncbi:hypothetical protein DL95DRAFT_403580 [Leptodontidium sp. 2 PMI_412]|nr:hypothetical protein DL95DRAFT_403580 [Leptodontidium sp. 2 PMI_412]
MPLTRASERTVAEESEGGGKSKRARKPNQNSTAAFSTNQLLIIQKTKRKRRDTTSKSTEKDTEDILNVLILKPLVKKSNRKTTTPEVIDVELSLIFSRLKPRPRPEFDPKALRDEPYKYNFNNPLLSFITGNIKTNRQEFIIRQELD